MPLNYELCNYELLLVMNCVVLSSDLSIGRPDRQRRGKESLAQGRQSELHCMQGT